MRCAVIAFALVFCLIEPALAEKRVALVVGNSAYEHAGALTNPTNDAADISASLERLGYEVITANNLRKPELEGAIRSFARRLEGADLGLFFYSGHGLQVAGVNYIVPVDAKLTTSDALDFELIRLDVVQRIMENAAKANVIFLDACRNNPLARNLARALGTRSAGIRQGLAAAEAGAGTLVSFSTQPGNVALDGAGRNSPFTAALLLQLEGPTDELSRLLIEVRRLVMAETNNQQIPWDHSSLTTTIYLGTPKPPAPLAVLKPPPSIELGPTCSEVERRFTSILGRTSLQRRDFETQISAMSGMLATVTGGCKLKGAFFFGPITKMHKCENLVTYIEIGGANGGAFIVNDETKSYQEELPKGTSAWAAVVADASHFCLARIEPYVIWPARHASLLGYR